MLINARVYCEWERYDTAHHEKSSHVINAFLMHDSYQIPPKIYHNLYFVLQNEKHETTSASLAKRFPSRDMFSEQAARVRGYDPIQNGIHRNSQT